MQFNQCAAIRWFQIQNQIIHMLDGRRGCRGTAFVRDEKEIIRERVAVPFR